jgi:DNA-binding HxlR family transcriptional regulator
MRAIKKDAGVRYVCPVDVTLDVIGRKWQPLILCALYAGPLHYNTLQSALPGVAHKVLTQQLRDLERNRVIARTERTERGGRRVEYALSDFGRTLRPVLKVMALWAKRHHRRVGATLETPPVIRARVAAVA